MNDLEKMEKFFQKLYDIRTGRYNNPLSELQEMLNNVDEMADCCFDLRNYITELEQANGLKVKVSA